MRDRREYEGDVFYDVWRSGGNPDRIDYDRVEDSRWEGLYPEEAAYRELRSQRPRPATPERLPHGRRDSGAQWLAALKETEEK